jgi:tyrosyl-tRNA synthetase
VSSTNALFSGGDFRGLSISQIADAFVDVPRVSLQWPTCAGDDVDPEDNANGMLAISVLDVAVQAGLVPSRKEAKRTVSAGGLYVNNIRVDHAGVQLTKADDIVAGKFTLLRKGKKAYKMIEWVIS